MPVLRMVNSDLIVLNWDVPFTWPYTVIDHYTVFANNSLENWNQTGLTNTSLEFRRGRFAECTTYTFTVLANNRLADGIPGIVTGGFPISM